MRSILNVLIALVAIVASILSGDGIALFAKIKERPTRKAFTPDTSLSLRLAGDKVTSDLDYVVNVVKEPDRDFVILNLADVQFSRADVFYSARAVAEKTVDALVAAVHPDLITLTGDQTSKGKASTLRAVAGIVDGYGIPWAPVFGNHDDRGDLEKQLEIYATYENCLLRGGPGGLGTLENGGERIGNYCVNIVEKDLSSPSGFYVVRSLILLNSGGDALPSDPIGGKQYDNLRYTRPSEKQIEWYKWLVTSLQPYGKDGFVPSTLLLHIPISSYHDAFAAAYNADFDGDYTAFEDAAIKTTLAESYTDAPWREGYEDSFGVLHEDIDSYAYDDGVFAAILDPDGNGVRDLVSTDLILCGHEHVNNVVIRYEGVTHAYGLKTGKAAYWEPDLSGGTVITLHGGAFTIEHKYIK